MRSSLVIAALALAGCAHVPPTFCPPDQLSSLPETLLQPCQRTQCLLPPEFSAAGLQAQAGMVGACHEAAIRAWTACAARQKELADWVRARKAPAQK